MPNSSKGRGFCPSCGARRMAATASHLVDHVIPRVPTRQWVLSLPFDLRFRLAFDRTLCGEVRTLFAGAVIALHRRRAAILAGSPHVTCWLGGAATWTQRFGDGLRLNIHFHAVVLDGAFESREEGPPRFVAVPAPTPQDLSRLASRVIRGIRRRLADLDPEGASEPAYLAEDAILAACLSAASPNRTALPHPGGPRVDRLVENSLSSASREADGARCEAGGFNLHAGPRIDANDRKRLERLCRYAGRPALSEAPLTPAGGWAHHLPSRTTVVRRHPGHPVHPAAAGGASGPYGAAAAGARRHLSRRPVVTQRMARAGGAGRPARAGPACGESPSGARA